MISNLNRRAVLTGLAALGTADLLAGCAPKKLDGMPVNVLSSQGTEVLTIQRLMIERGWCKQLGLAPNTLAVKSGTNIIGPLLQDQADICIFAGFSQLITAIEKGADLKILGGASLKGQQALFAKNTSIQHVRDLEGKTVGVGAIGAQLHQVVLALLRKKGVDSSRVRFVNVGSSGDVFRAVVAGTVDAGNGQADVLASVERLGVHKLQDGDYATELPEYTWQASFTSAATIKAKREVLVRTLAAYCKAFRYVQAPGSKADFVKAQLDALNPRDRNDTIAQATSQWDYLQAHKIYAEDLMLSPERVRWMQELNVELGNQKRVLPYDQLIDPSLAKEAVARLV